MIISVGGRKDIVISLIYHKGELCYTSAKCLQTLGKQWAQKSSYFVREFPTAVRNFIRNYLKKANPDFRVRGWTKGICEAQSAPVFPFVP